MSGLRLTGRGLIFARCAIALVIVLAPGFAGWIGYLITGVSS